MILGAAAGSTVLLYLFTGSVDNPVVQNDLRTVIFRIALGEIPLVLLGLAAFLAARRALGAEVKKLSEEKEGLAREKVRLEARENSLREELAKAGNSRLESERALEALREIYRRNEGRADQTREALGRIAAAAADIEGALRKLLEMAGEFQTRTESLIPPSPGPEAALSGGETASAELAGALRRAGELKMEINEGTVQGRAVKELITGIAENIESITELTGTINRISAQTNILSMNAAIESAHAGSAGAGFAVVAEEIKKLAESTEINAKQIRAEVKAIGEKTKAGVTAGDALAKTIEKTGKTAGTIEGFLTALSAGYSGGLPLTAQGGPAALGESGSAWTEQFSRLQDQWGVEYRRIKTELEKAAAQTALVNSSLRSLTEVPEQGPPPPAAQSGSAAEPRPPARSEPVAQPGQTAQSGPAAAEPWPPAQPGQTAHPDPIIHISDGREVRVKEPPRTVP
jgi:methyl-accepting chemotaxis protein